MLKFRPTTEEEDDIPLLLQMKRTCLSLCSVIVKQLNQKIK
jgi:hypothetical protein